jgi:hypothetical protein
MIGDKPVSKETEKAEKERVSGVPGPIKGIAA